MDPYIATLATITESAGNAVIKFVSVMAALDLSVIALLCVLAVCAFPTLLWISIYLCKLFL